MAALYTIGYTAFQTADFLDALENYGVKLLVDIRSMPYSMHSPEYNRPNIERLLKDRNIYYRNYAQEFGARQADRHYFSDEGYLNFEKFAQSPQFQQGFCKLQKSIEQGYPLALMCAEKDPATCHRSIMVSRVFNDSGYDVAHILSGGVTESQEDIELQLLNKYFPYRNQITLFDEPTDDKTLIAKAYKKRNSEIGYRGEDATDENIHDGVHQEVRTAVF
ncbi:MAG: DUF488 domain-containing protein [Oscillospiraceae bacterium]|nr:DUF488 domain-containing protein [Oscillospiraceae bacterium]